ncbi:DUF883 family protein [Pseudomonas schmalbachii]|uniref:DUF883 family protein n=1 Tax=Pseudomonas schmalbachii TaxID=2816993 RepID=A0ABS3TJG5_9PSED|nr:DUF883 family protein [Pseudomonas schmalbachii]MBO3273783.1 DUF883 family protein [Pseudomonas schmalbachii]
MLFTSRNHHPISAIQGKTIAELQALIDEMDSLLKTGREIAAEEAPVLRAKLGHLLDTSKGILDRTQRQGRAAVRASGEYVVEHPWQTALATGIACGLVAFLVMRRH